MIKNKVNVLQVLIGGKTFSGISSFLYQQYLHMDRDKVHYDFLFCKENSMKMCMSDSIFQDSKFYVLNAYKKSGSNNYKKVFFGLRDVLKKDSYDFVVVNTSVVSILVVCLFASFNSRNTFLIGHAHNTDIILSKKSIRYKFRFILNPLDGFFKIIIRKRFDWLFACSDLAGTLTFGKKVISNNNFLIVHNAIDTSKFKYDSLKRNSLRKSLGINEETYVYGNVGKLSKSKNQVFLIHIFYEIHQIKPESELWVIGDGSDREKLELLCAELGIKSSVRFFGQRNDVNILLQGMDSFIFTTLSEGLGIVAIEAQASGLPTTVSDGCPNDVFVSELVQKIPLSKSSKEWARSVLEFEKSFIHRKDTSKVITDAGYNIVIEAKRLTDFYFTFGKEGEDDYYSN